MFQWLKTRRKPDSEFSERFDEWLKERYEGQDIEKLSPNDLQHMRYICEWWWLKGQNKVLKERW